MKKSRLSGIPPQKNKEAGLGENFFSSDECHALCGMKEEIGIKLSQDFLTMAAFLTQNLGSKEALVKILSVKG